MKNFYSLFWASLALTILLPNAALAETRTITADSRALIPSVLELSVSQQGASELRFDKITPSSLGPTQTEPKLISIEVHSNSGEKYQVTQTISSALENATGEIIELENLKFKTTAAKSTGHGVSDFTPVSKGSQTIFTSDEQGSSESVSSEYQLTIPPSQAPGDYSALLTYTVSSV